MHVCVSVKIVTLLVDLITFLVPLAVLTQVKIIKNSYFKCLISKHNINLVSVDNSCILVRDLEIVFFCL